MPTCDKCETMLIALKIIAKRTNGGDTREAMVTRKIAKIALDKYQEAN